MKDRKETHAICLKKTNTNDPNSIAPRHGFSMEEGERETGETRKVEEMSRLSVQVAETRR
jgi:hypothetical protein